MKLLVKRFTLKRSGVAYGPGTIVDLPDEEGRRLIRSAPKNYEAITEPVVKPEAKKAASAAQKQKKSDALPEVKVEELVK